jgi:hypothetical protein
MQVARFSGDGGISGRGGRMPQLVACAGNAGGRHDAQVCTTFVDGSLQDGASQYNL